MHDVLEYAQDLRADPMAPYILLTYALGAVAVLLTLWFHARTVEKERNRQAQLEEAIANAKPVRGTISRFGTERADEYTVEYSFTLEGDRTVYQTASGYLSSASRGALTKPGDVVTFNVLPGYLYVRDFYNAATATGARR